jgi:signal transduction histidine kinase
MRPPFEQIVAAALGTNATAEILCNLVAVVQEAWGADQVSLSNGGMPPVCAAPEVPAPTIDMGALSEAPIVLADGDRSLLGVALRPFTRADWYLVLARAPRKPWTADECELLAACRSHLTLALAHALLHRQIADHIVEEKEAVAANERFLNVLSHELRNPLAPILMWTSTLRRLRVDDAEVQRATQAIAHAVSMERQLIEELLDVSRLQRGAVELSRHHLDLRELVRGEIDARRAAVDQGELSLVEELPDGPVRVHGDADRLRQAVGNLLANAIRYTPRGGTVAVKVDQQGERAQVRVSDTGPGLPPEVRATLFRPFVQGPNAHGGLGVGLSVAHGLVTLHQGTLHALERGERGGATMVVTLPVSVTPSGT